MRAWEKHAGTQGGKRKLWTSPAPLWGHYLLEYSGCPHWLTTVSMKCTESRGLLMTSPSFHPPSLSVRDIWFGVCDGTQPDHIAAEGDQLTFVGICFFFSLSQLWKPLSPSLVLKCQTPQILVTDHRPQWVKNKPTKNSQGTSKPSVHCVRLIISWRHNIAFWLSEVNPLSRFLHISQLWLSRLWASFVALSSGKLSGSYLLKVDTQIGQTECILLGKMGSIRRMCMRKSQHFLPNLLSLDEALLLQFTGGYCGCLWRWVFEDFSSDADSVFLKDHLNPSVERT